MRHTTLPALTLLSAITLVAAPAAQPPDMSPAKQVKQFEKLIGTWEGSGKVSHGAGMPAEKWTAKSSADWALGGHFVREDVSIKMPSMPNPLEIINLYGWDRENERYVQLEINNIGVARLLEVHFTADGKMITGGKSMMMGEPVVERWVSEFADGEVSFIGQQAEGAGPFYEMVSGSMKRTEAKAADVAIADAAFVPEMVFAQTAAIGKLAGAVGDYKMKGWFVPAPGADKMEFTGAETVHRIFGGSVIEMVTKGDPMPGMPDYEGLGWMSWDDHKKCYNMIYANNMGEVAMQEGRKLGNKIIMTSAGLYQGQPTAGRGVIELEADGSFGSSTGHHIMGDAEPVQVFEGVYEKN